MKQILVELFRKLVVYFLFIIIVFVATYSFVTGEFPPKMSKIRTSVTNLKQQIDNIKKLQQVASDQLLKQDFNLQTEVEKANKSNNEALKSLENAFENVSKSNSVSNEHYLRIYNELQGIKDQLGAISNRLDRIEKTQTRNSQSDFKPPTK